MFGLWVCCRATPNVSLVTARDVHSKIGWRLSLLFEDLGLREESTAGVRLSAHGIWQLFIRVQLQMHAEN